MGTQLPLPQMGSAPQFSAHLYCGHTVGCIKMPLGTEVGLGANDNVTWGPPQKRHTSQFSANVYCGQTAVCIGIPLGTEVGLILVDIVLGGDSARPP